MPIDTCPEGYVKCPYEDSHVVLISRLQTHLVKCKNVHKDCRLVECPFNSTHKIPEIELNCHKTYLCADRKKIDTYVWTQERAPLFPVQQLQISSSEDWDDVQHPTYNPLQRCKNMPVLLTLQGATPSSRKHFRAEERQRLRSLVENSKETPKDIPVSTSTRLPQTKSISDVKKMEKQENIVNSNGITIESKFQVPKYSLGRGRGRVQNMK